MLALVTLSGQAQTKKKATTAVEQISITAEPTLNPQQKVTAHMKAGSYEGPIGIKLRGNSSLSFNQKKYTIELRDENGKDVAASLLGMPAHSDWVLLAPYNDVSAVRDPLAFQLWRDMGHWAPRTRMVELTLNGDYRGIYILSEAIKRDSMRVDIAKLKKSDIAGRDVTGGYILRIDTYDEEDATFPSKVPGIGEGIMTSQITWSCIYPKKKKLQPEQLAYIEQFVDSMELATQSDDFADPQHGYAHFIDVPSFVDYFIHTELSLNADGYKRSAYFYKEKLHADGTGGKLVAGPVWDYNLAYGNCNFCNANNPEAWCFEGGNTQPTPAFWQRLLQDSAFRKAVKVRYKALRKGVLSNKAINSYIDQHAKLLAPYIARHFEKYPELLVSEEEKGQSPTPPAFSFPPMGNFHMPEGFKMPEGVQMPDSIPAFPGAFPPMGFPMMGGFHMPDSISIPEGFQMPDSIPAFPGGFPPMGGFPMMGGFHMPDSISLPEGFQMPDSIPAFPGGFPPMGGFPMIGGGFPMMDGFGGNAISWFAAYRVSSYDEEIATLKEWLANRLAFLDRNIERFDKDWEPHIQIPKEIKMPQFNGGFPFHNPF
jgi:hypothetical protein